MTARRKKIATLALIASLALFGVIYGIVSPSSALAWDDCPKGFVNDPFPGACRRYVDTNEDSICDLSQPKPTDCTTSTTLAVATTTSAEPPTGDCPLGPCAGCGACLSISSIPAASSTIANATIDVAGTSGQSGGSFLVTQYNITPIAIAFFLVYAVSFSLYQTKRIKTRVHRKIWNVLLLTTFLITGIFGLILTIQLDYKLPFTIPVDLLFWHVEAGVVMTLISLFHLGWHFNYYRGLVRVGRKRAESAEARRTQREQRRLSRPDDRRAGHRATAPRHSEFGSEA